MVRFLTDKQKNMIKETEIIDIIKNYVGYTDRSMTDQCLHEVNFDLVAKEIVKKLTIPVVIESCTINGKGLCEYSDKLGFCPRCDTDAYSR